jgi:uncharacterized protein DUF5615
MIVGQIGAGRTIEVLLQDYPYLDQEDILQSFVTQLGWLTSVKPCSLAHELLLDMNLAPRWVEFLEEAKFQALHWSQIGRANAPDTEIMEYAGANDLSC